MISWTKISTLRFAGVTWRVRFECKYQVFWRSLLKLTLEGCFLFWFIFIGRFFNWTVSTWWLSKRFNQEVKKKSLSLSWWEDFEHELSKIKKISKCGDENIILEQKVPSLLKSNWSWECLLLLSLSQDRGNQVTETFWLWSNSIIPFIELSSFLFVPGLLLSCHNW